MLVVAIIRVQALKWKLLGMERHFGKDEGNEHWAVARFEFHTMWASGGERQQQFFAQHACLQAFS